MFHCLGTKQITNMSLCWFSLIGLGIPTFHGRRWCKSPWLAYASHAVQDSFLPEDLQGGISHSHNRYVITLNRIYLLLRVMLAAVKWYPGAPIRPSAFRELAQVSRDWVQTSFCGRAHVCLRWFSCGSSDDFNVRCALCLKHLQQDVLSYPFVASQSFAPQRGFPGFCFMPFYFFSKNRQLRDQMKDGISSQPVQMQVASVCAF